MRKKKEKVKGPCFFCDGVSGTFGCEVCVPEEWRYIEIHEQKPPEIDKFAEEAKRLQRKVAYKRK